MGRGSLAFRASTRDYRCSTVPRSRYQAPDRAEADSKLFDSGQRVVVVALLGLVPIVFWRAAADVFALPKAALIWVASIVLLAIVVSKVAWTRQVSVPWTPLTAAVGAFLVAAMVATLTSPTIGLSFFGEFERYTGLLNYACYAILALTVAMSFDQAKLVMALRWVTVIAVLPLTYAVVQWSGNDPWRWTDFGFVSTFSTFGGSNFLAGYAAIVLALAAFVALDRTGPSWIRATAAAVTLEALLVSVISHSIQGPIAGVPGLAVVVGTAALVRSRADVSRRVVAAVVAAAIVLVVVVSFGPLRAEISEGLGERKYFWGAAVELTKDHPVLGTGMDTFGQNWFATRSPKHFQQFGDELAEAPHSVPLGMFSNGGLLLGLTYLGVLATTAYALVVAFRRSTGEQWLLIAAIAGAWVAYQLQAAVSMDLPGQALLHWFLIGATLVLVRSPSRQVPLPGRPVSVIGKGRHQRRIIPPATLAALGVAAVAALVGVIWVAVVPVAADVDAGSGYRTAASGEVDQGLRRIEQATSTAPWRSRYWLLQTAVLENVRAYDRALRPAEEAARREPGSSEYAMFAARLADQVKDMARASHWYREAVERNPLSWPVLLEATRWAADHPRPWGRDAAERLVRAQPGVTENWILLARIDLAGGDVAAARRAYRRVLELEPTNAEATQYLSSGRAPRSRS
jgi:O-antigen ligase